MNPVLADLVVRWTARAFVICYVWRLGLGAAGRRDHVSQRATRWIWSLGCVICWIHFAVAFQLVHHGSLQEAYQHVREVTERSTGFATGIGLYVNFAFGLLWLADVVFWWRDLGWSERRVPYWTVQVCFAFLIFEATVVFGPHFWMVLAPAIVMMLVGLRVGFAARRRLPPPGRHR